MLRDFGCVLALGIISLASSSFAIDPLSVAGPGVATSTVLDKLDEQAAQLLSNAAASGSLRASKSAREIRLEIVASREQFHDELGQNWDGLDRDSISALRALDGSVVGLRQNVDQGGDLTSDLALDIDKQLTTIPLLAKTATIRRII